MMSALEGNFRISANNELFGWARDPADPDRSLTLELSLDGDPAGTVVADLPRPDLAARMSFTRVGLFVDLAQFPAAWPGRTLRLTEAASGREVPPGMLVLPVPRAAAAAPAFALGSEGALRIVATRHGTMLLNARDGGVDRELLEYGEYAEAEVAVMRAVTPRGAAIADVGANIGALVLPLARLAVDGVVVYAYEPQPNVFHRLCANLALNGLTNVVARNVAVGAAAATGVVPHLDYTTQHVSGGVRIAFAGAGQAVPVVALDAEDFGAAPLGLLKIDVEGHEAAVIEGAAQRIASDRPAIYVECRSRAAFARIRAVLDPLGYRYHWHAAMLFRPDNFFANRHDYYHGAGINSNVLAFPGAPRAALPDDLLPLAADDEFWPAARFPETLRERVTAWSRTP